MADIKQMKFSNIYDAYLNKIERKKHSKTELDSLILWLTNYNQQNLDDFYQSDLTFGEFINNAKFNPASQKITGKICGVRVEEITDPFMQKVRYLDKIVDELAKNKAIATIKRK